MHKGWRTLAIILLFLLAGCQAAPPAPLPTKTPIPPTPAIEATEVATEVVMEVDECVSCHTDKERLIETAEPVEVVEKESSGVG